MLRYQRNKSDQRPQDEGNSDEDVYNFIKRERASQKDLNISRINELKHDRAQSTSLNRSQEFSLTKNYIENVK
jgi:hypothetical protein